MAPSIKYRTIIRQGLWDNNPARVQLLGLCPLLAISNTFQGGVSLGIATTYVLMMSNCVIALIRRFIPDEIRLPIFVLIIASLTSILELIMQAYFFTAYETLGIFLPLIVTNCALLGRAEVFATRHPVLGATLDGLMMGLGFTWVLCLLGGIRETLGESLLLILLSPAGAFITLGLLMALINAAAIRVSTK